MDKDAEGSDARRKAKMTAMGMLKTTPPKVEDPCILCGAMITTKRIPHSSACTNLHAKNQCRACIDLSDIETEIEETRSLLERLLKDCRQKKEASNQRHDPFLRLLPHEIAADIFREAMEADGHWDNQVLTNLASVSRWWRQVAVNEPVLWTRITITLGAKQALERPQNLRAWIGRSHPRPLRIFLSHARGSTPSLYNADSLFRALSECSQRWHSLRLRLPSTLLSSLKTRKKSSSILEILEIQPTELSSDGEPQRTPNELQLFEADNIVWRPNLLDIAGIPFRSLNILWDNIAHLTAASFHVDECLEAIRRCPKLISCDFTNILPGLSGFPLPKTPVVTNLLDLRLLDATKQSFKLLSHISTPSLDFFASGLDGALIPFLTRVSPPLKTFIVTTVKAQTPVIPVLLLLPTLQALVLMDTGDLNNTHSLCHLLAETAKAPEFLPRLQLLNITAAHGHDPKWSDVVKMLTESSVNGTTNPGPPRRPLSKFKLKLEEHDAEDLDPRWINRASLKKLQILKKTPGFEIAIEDYDGQFDLLEVEEKGLASFSEMNALDRFN